MSLGRYFGIRSDLNGYALHIRKGGEREEVVDGSPVIMHKFNAKEHELWYEDLTFGVIRSKKDGSKCLETKGGKLVIGEFDDNNSDQKWMTWKNRVVNRENPGQVLDVEDADASHGARVIVWEFNGGENQSWTFDWQPPALFLLKCVESGLVLDVKGNNEEPGAEVCMWESNGGDNQLWYEDRIGNIYSKLSGMAFDANEGDDMILNPFDGTMVGRNFCKCGPRVVNRIRPDLVLDVRDHNTDPGAPLCVWPSNDGENQSWETEYVSADPQDSGDESD